MARRHVLGPVLVAAILVVAAYALQAPTASTPSLRVPGDSRATGTATLEGSRSAAPDAVIGERTERVSEASNPHRRLSSRDGRPLEWLALVGIAAASLAALAGALTRRAHRRAATTTRWLAPSRAPPLLLPS